VLPFLLGSIGTFYGVIAGLVLSESWSDLTALQQTVTAEANALAELNWVATHLPTGEASQFGGAVHSYLDSVIEVELPRLAQGEITPNTTRVLDQLWSALARYRPVTPWETQLQGVALDRVMALGEHRRLRILASRETLPAVMWCILIGGALIMAIGACVGSLSHQRPASSFVAALTGILALVLFVIFALDQPFRYGLDRAVLDYGLLRDGFAQQGSVFDRDTSRQQHP
jgi:hypothetical protein